MDLVLLVAVVLGYYAFKYYLDFLKTQPVICPHCKKKIDDYRDYHDEE